MMASNSMHRGATTTRLRKLCALATVVVAFLGCSPIGEDPEHAGGVGATVAADPQTSEDRLSSTNGLAALHVAARLGDLESIQNLAAAGADLDRIDGRQTGWTPLLHAVHNNQVSAVSTLLLLGADPNRPGTHGSTPLVMASAYGNTEMVLALLEGGADPQRRTTRGDTPLLAAVTGSTDIDRFTLGSCQAETVRALLEHAPDLRLPDSKLARATLFYHRLRGCAEMRQLLQGR